MDFKVRRRGLQGTPAVLDITSKKVTFSPIGNHGKHPLNPLMTDGIGWSSLFRHLMASAASLLLQLSSRHEASNNFREQTSLKNSW